MPLPLRIDNQPYQSSLSSGLFRTSYPSTSKHQSQDNEQIVDNKQFYDIKLGIKRRSSGSSPSISSLKMQKQTTNESDIGVPSQFCSVCGDISTGIHFGGNSCESCKAFFRRSVQCLRFQNYKCSNDEQCPVNTSTRKVCQYCRYAKCTAIGMKPKWVLSDQEREEKYGSRRKRFREKRTTEEDPDIYKYLTKEEKLLIEDIAHALYQSRATYPLNFPSPSTLFGNVSNSTSDNTNVQSPNNEKPPSAPANLLIVPIQRLVLFARMLKDFDLFSEDDKVNLLKGSAIEIMVCSSNTLFNPKTHTFTNYLSRDQRAVVDDQILPLDPLLTKLWGEDIFNRTRNFLISMCNLHVDEVTSTLLAPIILFSPDRLNINDLNLVKRLQEKYATILRKYMNWRYGVEQTENIYPKLLLQIVNLRSLSLAHGEIIQKFMATSSVNPLVQEVTIKPEMLNKLAREKNDSFSLSSSSPTDIDMTDYDKTPSNETESNNGSDEDDFTKKKLRLSPDDYFDYDNEDIDESNPRNIWRKRRKLSHNDQVSSMIQTEITTIEQTNSNNNYIKTPNDYKNIDQYPQASSLYMKPHDHQVPAILSTHQDGSMIMSNKYSTLNQFRQLPTRKQSLATSPHSMQQYQQIYRAHSSSTNDLTSFDYQPQSNQVYNPTIIPTVGQCYDDQTYENYNQQYAHMSAANYQQQQNEQQLLLLSLANSQNQTSPISHSPNHVTNQQSQSATCSPARSTLDEDEQQLLNAIHAHPNKRDLVLNLLRQMNQSPLLTPSPIHQQQQQQQTNPYYNHHQQQQQQRHSDSSPNYKPYKTHAYMDHNNE
ncbi:unnamed protein product [Rotaria sp. Silwood1]|nr:unnamed protein product [Rotaria sp. Silwood1]